MPQLNFIPPQLLKPASRVPSGPEWVYEEKYDGYRAQVHIKSGSVQFFTRNGHDWTARFPQLVAAFRRLPTRSAILDGEICALDHTGRSDFTALCRSFGADSGPLTFMVFDVLMLNGEVLIDCSLDERRTRLERLLDEPVNSSVELVPQQPNGGEKLLGKMRELHREGIVAKRRDSPYFVGQRAPCWRKMKLIRQDSFHVIGWHSSGQTVQSLLLASEAVSGALVYRGRVGTGFSVRERCVLAARLTAIEAAHKPDVAIPVTLQKSVRWVRPELTANIRYTELSPRGILRSPAYLGIGDLMGSLTLAESTPCCPSLVKLSGG